jgi:hypothetical protein
MPGSCLCTSEHRVAEDASYTTHNKFKRRTYMFSAGFEPATQVIKRLHTYVLDSTTTGIGFIVCKCVFLCILERNYQKQVKAF